jgi:hypothetical protein
MLPPVSSVSSSSPSYQNPAPQPAQPATASSVQQVTITDSGMDSTAAARFNILKLAGSEAMADPLLDLAQTLGKIINLPRQDGEAGADYMQRLSQAMKTLSPGDRANVARMLNQIVQGVQLRLLAQAFANPVGPEAAKLVMLLEMAGYKERDLAARAVVSSYRQNAGADLPMINRSGNTPLLAPRDAPGAYPANPQSVATAASMASGSLPSGSQAPSGETVVVATAADPAGDVEGREPDQPSATATGAPDESAQTPIENAGSRRPEAAGSEARPASARALQGQLQQALASPVTASPAEQVGESDNASSGKQPAPVRGQAQNNSADARPVLTTSDRELPMSKQMMLVLAEWSDPEVSLRPTVMPIAAGDLLPTSAALKVAQPADVGPAGSAVSAPTSLAAQDDLALHRTDGETTSPTAAEEPLAPGLREIQAKTDATERTAAMMEQQMAQLRLAVTRDGLPLPYVPYPVVHEFDDPAGTASDLHREHDEEASEDQGAAADDGGAADEQTDEVQDISPEITEPERAEEADPAYDLYRRMAGWG